MSNLKIPGSQSPLPNTSTFGAPTPVGVSGFTYSLMGTPMIVVALTGISVAAIPSAARALSASLIYPTASTFVGGSVGYPL